ncbi:radical SAM protein [Paractinoplanes brasiliensis]|uniref:4Fe-4S single cluster protein n=1 Tax=Paractinoplanes brasiliensis TaxID=52695 RepID=A0A4R6JCQ5_9ACTN|nr:radical SAM protein [Actinoplanes brasiliensis]TDO32731.1 4Fe-4S single cluster protein [Actinoplanes brasiliensis]GID31727.1 hypothetical protein Abr02nite_67100 [Actinoplanes brasiliensis]
MPLAAQKLRLITTGACNLACFYCHNEGQAKEDTFARPGDLRRVSTAVRDRGLLVSEVTISGGEPLLHPELDDIVSLAADVCARVTMVSNGLLADGRRLDRLAAAGLRKLRLGVDSLDTTKPRPSRGRLPTPFVVGEVIETARAAGLEVDLNTVLTRYNRQEVGTLIALAQTMNVSIKFFEHVAVQTFGADGTGGVMAAKPQVPYEDFLQQARLTLGQFAEFTPAGAFGDANLHHVAGDFEVRYCRYLCNFDLCWLTGTRVDPHGYVYNCMSNRGIDRLTSRMTLDEVADLLERGSARQCRSSADRASQR